MARVSINLMFSGSSFAASASRMSPLNMAPGAWRKMSFNACCGNAYGPLLRAA
jgi:hypothetical protein